MINNEEKKKITFILVTQIIVWILVAFSLLWSLTLLFHNTNLNITTVFGLLFLIIDLITIIINSIYLSNRKINGYVVSKKLYLIFTLSCFITLIGYFTSIFALKLNIIGTSNAEVFEHIINGNPALILSTAKRINVNLNSLLAIFSGLNSEFILLFAILFLFGCYFRAKGIKFEEEELTVNEEFIFSKPIYTVSIILLISSFLSLDIFKLFPTFLDAIKLLICLILFTFWTIITVIYSSILNHRNSMQSRKYIHNFYLFLRVVSITSVFLLVGLISLLFLNINTLLIYKLPLAFIMLVVDIYVIVKLHKLVYLSQVI